MSLRLIVFLFGLVLCASLVRAELPMGWRDLLDRRATEPEWRIDVDKRVERSHVTEFVALPPEAFNQSACAKYGCKFDPQAPMLLNVENSPALLLAGLHVNIPAILQALNELGFPMDAFNSTSGQMTVFAPSNNAIVQCANNFISTICSQQKLKKLKSYFTASDQTLQDISNDCSAMQQLIQFDQQALQSKSMNVDQYKNIQLSSSLAKYSAAEFMYGITKQAVQLRSVDVKQLVPSMLTDPQFVNLGGQPQQIFIKAVPQTNIQTMKAAPPSSSDTSSNASAWELVYSSDTAQNCSTPIVDVDLQSANGFLNIYDYPLSLPTNISLELYYSRLNSFLAALNYSGLLEEVDAMTGVTMFVPSEPAWAAIKSKLPTELQQSIDRLSSKKPLTTAQRCIKMVYNLQPKFHFTTPDEAKVKENYDEAVKCLKAHIVSGVLYQSDLDKLASSGASVTTLSGQQWNVTQSSKEKQRSAALSSDAPENYPSSAPFINLSIGPGKVLFADLLVSNGVIHIVDNLLKPPQQQK